MLAVLVHFAADPAQSPTSVMQKDSVETAEATRNRTDWTWYTAALFLMLVFIRRPVRTISETGKSIAADRLINCCVQTCHLLHADLSSACI